MSESVLREFTYPKQIQRRQLSPVFRTQAIRGLHPVFLQKSQELLEVLQTERAKAPNVEVTQIFNRSMSSDSLASVLTSNVSLNPRTSFGQYMGLLLGPVRRQLGLECCI